MMLPKVTKTLAARMKMKKKMYVGVVSGADPKG